MLNEVICTFKLIQSQMISQLHLLFKKKKVWAKKKTILFMKWEMGDCESTSQGSEYLGTQFLIWFYRCWANQNTVKTKNVRGALWLRMPKGLQCYFTSFCNVSFSSFLMNECQNIELDKLLFIFIMCCILNLYLVFIFHFNCQYVYNAERSLPFEF